MDTAIQEFVSAMLAVISGACVSFSANKKSFDILMP